LNCIFGKSFKNTRQFNVSNAQKDNTNATTIMTKNGIKTPNNGLQGTSRQRGFPESNLAAKIPCFSKLSAANPACP